MRTPPLEPSVELPMELRSVRGVCRSGPEYAGEARHWSIRWSCPWGRQMGEGCAEMDPSTHARRATGAFGGAPYGPTKRVRGVPKWRRRSHANPATGAFGKAPYGAAKRVRGVPKWRRRRHATWAFGGSPYGATNRVRVCRNGHAVGGVDACGRGHWGLGWNSLWGHEPCEGCADMGMRWAGWTHVSAATGAFGGAPHGGTNRVRGVPKCVRVMHVSTPTWALGAPYGATHRMRGVPKWACGGRGGRMRTWPLGPSVELRIGPHTE